MVEKIIELAKENFKEDYLKQNVINLPNAIGKREYKYIYTCHTEILQKICNKVM